MSCVRFTPLTALFPIDSVDFLTLLIVFLHSFAEHRSVFKDKSIDIAHKPLLITQCCASLLLSLMISLYVSFVIPHASLMHT